MRRLLLIVALCLVCVGARRVMVVQPPVAAGSSCPGTVSDNFNRTNATPPTGWVADGAAGQWAGAADTVMRCSSGLYERNARYNTVLAGSATEWACGLVNNNDECWGFMARSTGATSARYLIMGGPGCGGGDNIFLIRTSNATTNAGEVNIGAAGAGNLSAGDWVCYQVTGTGSGTVHKIWNNPSGCDSIANCIANYDSWSATAPLRSHTGLVNGGSVDTGTYVGFSSGGASGNNYFDDFVAGGCN